MKQFVKLAESQQYRPPKHLDFDDLEKKYWNKIKEAAETSKQIVKKNWKNSIHFPINTSSEQ